MLEHARVLGFLATRREFRRAPAPAVPARADALIVKMVEATTLEQGGNLGKVTAAVKKRQPVAVAKPAAKKAPPKSVPAKKTVAKKAAAKKTVPKKAATKKAVATAIGATPPSVAEATRITKPPPAPEKNLALPKSASKKATPAAKPQVPLTAAQIARRVLVSLGKMATNKPGKKGGLMKMIKSHAGPVGNNDATATLVLSLLQAQRQVAISEQGTAVSYPQLVPPSPKESKNLI
jgi:hypothetical protein